MALRDNPFSTHHRQGKRRLTGTAVVALLVVVVLAYAGILLGVRAVGNRIEGEGAQEPVGSLEGRFADDNVEMQYSGRTWSYRKRDLTNLLLIGVDWADSETAASERYAGQADFLLLMTIDRRNKTVSALQLDRDTITDIRIFGTFGDFTGIRATQLCLSHAYGKTAEDNCENTGWAVSRLLAGIPIDGYLALDMGGIAVLNDALGGVTVTLDEDFSSLDPQMTKGATLRLQGDQAEKFVRGRRDVGDGTNAARMRRQRAFIDAAQELLLEQMNEDINSIGRLYDALEEHLTTNLQRGWLVNKAYECREYSWQDTKTPVGSHVVGADGFMEFHVDADALDALLAENFFE